MVPGRLTSVALIVLVSVLGVVCSAKESGSHRAVPLTMPVPEYPAHLLADGVEGTVEILVRIDQRGMVADARVRSSSDPRFNDVCESIARKWRFKPAEYFGKRTGDERTLTIRFEGRGVHIDQPEGSDGDFIPAKVVKQVAPHYPAELLDAGNDGRVTIEFIVDDKGVPQNPVVVTSTHPAFEKPAVKALLQWRFKPAEGWGRPVESKMRVPIMFAVGMHEGGVESFSVGKGRKKGLPEELRVDVPPKPKTTVYAVHPYDQAIAGKRGTAEIKVLVGPEGNVIGTQVGKASSPEFGLSLAAAMEAWTFDPALKEGKRTVALIRREYEFTTRDRDSAIDYKTSALAARIRKGNFEPASPSSLDTPLRPRFTAPPVYPTAFLGKGIAGTAKVEVIVDGEGRAVLPRIVEASAPEFGWAAATAVQRWFFEPPTVGGKPAEIRVQIPFKFSPPEDDVENAK